MTRLSMPNRRIRGRMYGGVGGEVSNGLPYPKPCQKQLYVAGYSAEVAYIRRIYNSADCGNDFICGEGYDIIKRIIH